MPWREYVDPTTNEWWITDDNGNFLPGRLSDHSMGSGSGSGSSGNPNTRRGPFTSGYDWAGLGRALGAMNQQEFDEMVRQFNAMLDLEGKKLGLQQQQIDMLKDQFNKRLYSEMATSLLASSTQLASSPANWLDYANYTSGGRDIFQTLFGGQTVPSFGAPTGRSEPNSITNLLKQLGIVPGTLAGSAPGPNPPPNISDDEALDWIWKNKTELKAFYEKNGWDVSTVEKQRAAVRNWITKANPVFFNMTPQQVAAALGYKAPAAPTTGVAPEYVGENPPPATIPPPEKSQERSNEAGIRATEPPGSESTRPPNIPNQPYPTGNGPVDNPFPRNPGPFPPPPQPGQEGGPIQNPFPRNPGPFPPPPQPGQEGGPMGNPWPRSGPFDPNGPYPPGWPHPRGEPDPYEGSSLSQILGAVLGQPSNDQWGIPHTTTANIPASNWTGGIPHTATVNIPPNTQYGDIPHTASVNLPAPFPYGPDTPQTPPGKPGSPTDPYRVPLPHQINPAVWDSLSPTAKQMILAAAKRGHTESGVWTPEDFMSQLNAARPRGTVPRSVRMNWANPTGLF